MNQNLFFKLLKNFKIFFVFFLFTLSTLVELKSKNKWEYNMENLKQPVLKWKYSEDNFDKTINKKNLSKKTHKYSVIKGIGQGITVNNYPYPEISNYVPHGFVEDNFKSSTISIRTLNKTRGCHGDLSHCADAILNIDYFPIKKENYSLGFKHTTQSLSSRGIENDKGTKFGEAQSLGFKSAWKLNQNWSFAIGGENVIHFDKKTDLGRNYYLIFSTYRELNDSQTPSILFFNSGFGSDFYGYRGNGFLGRSSCLGSNTLTGNETNKCQWGPISSISLAFNDRISVNSEWFGYGYGIGLGIRPFKDSSVSISIYATDFIPGFPDYNQKSCIDNSCDTRLYSSLSISF
ncbi:putative conserved secreted protein [Prochlorococcus marinus str. SB]|uniref:Putative conserved secreted protein n=2 Tax=Prochlorococcus marinus TaxID=1219 RepID=A0A0A2B8H0_PROMR|nr:putative conserved secreted protein [Prochlorococcus marinus str. SB]|tara:strand:+ start:16617 stop:17657 length:1041 start_codon:yes stop_codon:yes gene_type:complete